MQECHPGIDELARGSWLLGKARIVSRLLVKPKLRGGTAKNLVCGNSSVTEGVAAWIFSLSTNAARRVFSLSRHASFPRVSRVALLN